MMWTESWHEKGKTVTVHERRIVQDAPAQNIKGTARGQLPRPKTAFLDTFRIRQLRTDGLDMDVLAASSHFTPASL